MHESGVDIDTIAMVLGNTPRVVAAHYILSSTRNYDACDIAKALIHGNVTKSSNMFVNQQFMSIKNESVEFSNVTCDHKIYDN